MIQQKIKTAQKLWDLWRIDEATQRFIEYNRQLWGFRRAAFTSPAGGVTAPKEVLCNFDPVCLTHVKFSYLMNKLAEQHEAIIKTFSMRTPASQRRLWSVYQSFNTAEYVYVRPYGKEHPAVQREVERAWLSVKTKEDLLGLEVMGLPLGVDIYETYLMKFGHPTVNLADPALHGLIAETVGLAWFWRDYFAAHDVRAVGMSIDGYTANNTVTKVAQAAGVPVYTPDFLAPRIRDVPFAAAVAYKDFRKLFAALPWQEQERGIMLAEQHLNRRMAGEVGVDMLYSTKSAWHRDFLQERIVQKSLRPKVLICSHDFIDAPHSHGGMLFCDFVDWLLFVAKAAHKTDYDWYLKLHADHDPLSGAAVEQIKNAFPRLMLVPAAASHHQLIQEGINVVLTCYGSVGHEYPLHGIPVVNAAYNPHIAYSFNYHARSQAQYHDLLLRLGELPCRVDPEEVYEFYYMYHYDEMADLPLGWLRNLLVQFPSDMKQAPAVYDWWRQQVDNERHRAIVEHLAAIGPKRIHHLAELA